jgi:hypothetical protein
VLDKAVPPVGHPHHAKWHVQINTSIFSEIFSKIR